MLKEDVYGVYYDFAAHCHFDGHGCDSAYNFMNEFHGFDYGIVTHKRIKDKVFFGYSGIVHPDGKSNEVRLSSIPKGEEPICFMTYNQNGYESHCKKFKEYQEWVEKRNPVRYESNLKSNYDRKNMMHCVRLIHMGKELAEGKGFNVVRTWDREMLLDIRNNKYEYDEIIEYVEKLYKETDEMSKTCNLPDTVDKEKVHKLLIEARKLC